MGSQNSVCSRRRQVTGTKLYGITSLLQEEQEIANNEIISEQAVQESITPPRKRIRIANAVSGNDLCEIDAEVSWDSARLKCEIELLTGIAAAHQHLMIGGHAMQDQVGLASVCADMREDSASLGFVSLLNVNWSHTLAVAFPEVHNIRVDLGLAKRTGRTTQLVGDEWLQCCASQKLPSLSSTVDYIVALKFEIAETWKQTTSWGQILLFTANGFPQFEQYPFRCPDFVLESSGEPKLLVVVSNLDDDNQHISEVGLACTDYDLPTGVEISVMLVVSGDLAAIYIDGEEVQRNRVGKREAHHDMEVYPNPPDEGWISYHGYEVPNRHVRIRQVYYVAFPA